MTVQVNPTFLNTITNEHERCEAHEADVFSVYKTVDDLYKWLADFDSPTDALNWANEVAKRTDDTVEDNIYLKENQA